MYLFVDTYLYSKASKAKGKGHKKRLPGILCNSKANHSDNGNVVVQ